jgi:hypothetical protein
MKKLEIQRLEEINGGLIGNIINGACAAGGVWTVGAYLGLVTAVAVSGGTAVALVAACTVNAIGTGNGWWD